MLLPLPRYLAAGRDIESLPVGEGTIINSGPLALRKVSKQLLLLNSRGVSNKSAVVQGIQMNMPVSRKLKCGVGALQLIQGQQRQYYLCRLHQWPARCTC